MAAPQLTESGMTAAANMIRAAFLVEDRQHSRVLCWFSVWNTLARTCSAQVAETFHLRTHLHDSHLQNLPKRVSLAMKGVVIISIVWGLSNVDLRSSGPAFVFLTSMRGSLRLLS